MRVLSRTRVIAKMRSIIADMLTLDVAALPPGGKLGPVEEEDDDEKNALLPLLPLLPLLLPLLTEVKPVVTLL